MVAVFSFVLWFCMVTVLCVGGMVCCTAAEFESKVKNTFEDELADVLIRVFDLCGWLGIDIQRHLELKMHYNAMREFKHGRNY